MSGKKKTLGVILILFVYVVIAIIGFFVVYMIKTHLQKQPVVTKTIPISTPAPAPTGYKTYENPKQKIAVSYPSDLKVKENSYGFGVNTVELRSPDNVQPSSTPDIQILTVPKMMAQAIGQDFDSYYAMADNTTKEIKSPVGNNKTAESFTKVKNREIQGMRAVEYSSVPAPNTDNQEPEIGVFIETGDEMTIIATGESERAQLEEMLKTFTYPTTK